MHSEEMGGEITVLRGTVFWGIFYQRISKHFTNHYLFKACHMLVTAENKAGSRARTQEASAETRRYLN